MKTLSKNTIVYLVVTLFVVWAGQTLADDLVTKEEKYDNGQLKMRYTAKKSASGKMIKQGLYQSWYENGQKKYEQEYVDGKLNGPSKLWYKNGQLRINVNYVNGERDGDFIEFYENGQQCSAITYSAGKKVGKLISWHKNGQKMKSVIHQL